MVISLLRQAWFKSDQVGKVAHLVMSIIKQPPRPDRDGNGLFGGKDVGDLLKMIGSARTYDRRRTAVCQTQPSVCLVGSWSRSVFGSSSCLRAKDTLIPLNSYKIAPGSVYTRTTKDTSISQQILFYVFPQIWTSPVQYVFISILIVISSSICIPLNIYPI